MALIEINEATLKRLREVAAQRQQSVESVLEELVARYLEEAGASPDFGALATGNAVQDAWRGLVGLGHSGQADTASRMREVMNELTYPHRAWSLKGNDEGTR